jgi:hypothetical protein
VKTNENTEKTVSNRVAAAGNIAVAVGNITVAGENVAITMGSKVGNSRKQVKKAIRTFLYCISR